MYAIIEDSGRQYKVEPGQELVVDYREVPAGQEVKFDQVLAVSDESGVSIGTPVVEGAVVTGEVLGVSQGPKLTIRQFRRRKNSRRKIGHRQLYTTIRIAKIETP